MSDISLYTKKPVEVEATRWDGTAKDATRIIDWALRNGGTIRYDSGDADAGVPESLAIDTLEGTMRALPSEWVVKSIVNEFYPVKPEIFKRSYSKVLY